MDQFASTLRFLRGFVSNPLRVASPVASDPELAELITDQIESVEYPILELGPGTGAVTAALLERGLSASQLVAIESDKRFVEFLQERFPLCRILDGDAFDLDRTLRLAGWTNPFGAIVCGIPVLSHALEKRRQLLETGMSWARAGAPFVQFSYAAHPPLPVNPQLEVRHAGTWRNILPIHVWVYRHPAAQ